ncbi:hypothetical protein EFS21_10230 [Levilactobacillus brevis]|jgi:hypothetical protein|uniref:hypothetical protein n=1 Tax=Levilactobacillus brevis TaxID=1580 RepID=UPI0005AA1A63|nr:hypothetical protein [Levilactobacillus brevis]KWT44217.1 hypothetical protein ABB39_12035 [Levilactobacillus brevis]KWU39141.1 hypothetical protein AV935_12025 [Levilactobacillus brevis]MCS6164756.1 hypothetical protein [Levilactobacillus brevis]MCS8597991.1 hypothetical protein [Levilactobacillus brevis]MCT3582284.1 hypothetical protein [Levilactobacillus brevis]
MAIYKKSGTVTKWYHRSKIVDANSKGQHAYHDYALPSSVLWSGEALFSTESMSLPTGVTKLAAPLELPIAFKDLRGIRLTFGTAVIKKTYDSGLKFYFRSGETTSDGMAADGTWMKYPTTVTLMRSQLLDSANESTVFNPTDITTDWPNPSLTAFVALSDGIDKLVLGQHGVSFKDNGGWVMSKQWDTFGANYLYGYPVLTKIEAI